MATVSYKRLRSAIHSAAHHAVSGLCYVHPHLGQACNNARLKSAYVNLLKAEIAPPSIRRTRSIELATDALREKFREILLSERIDTKLLATAGIMFKFSEDRYPSGCFIEVQVKEGRKLEIAVGQIGKKAEIIEEST